MNYATELNESLQYLASNEALKALETDAYWPKWHSPWWHMLLLHEMGETKRIPEAAIHAHVATLNRKSLKIFPIHAEEMPADIDPYRECPCHCQLGNVYQVLAAWGIDVDKELPWIRPWLLRYQMADGGLNCDSDAYLVTDETPSSMVGAIAAFEAILLYTPRPWTEEEQAFLQRGAQFLINRKLMHASQTKYNSSERESAKDWLKLCFPRFYFYDVLRGLNALLIWSEKNKQSIPAEGIHHAVTQLEARFAEGTVYNERLSYADTKTLSPPDSGRGEWLYGKPAPTFSLLDKVSRVGEVSPILSKQWADARKRLEQMIKNEAD